MQQMLKMFQEIENLPQPFSLTQLGSVVKSQNDIEKDLIQYIDFSEEHYTRSSVYKSANFEALVLAWKPMQRTPIHNHKGSACVVRVIKGRATEITYLRSTSGMLYPAASHMVEQGQVVASFDQDMHQMANLENEDLITLHIYAPALSNMELVPVSETCHKDYDQIVYNSSKLRTRSLLVEAL